MTVYSHAIVTRWPLRNRLPVTPGEDTSEFLQETMSCDMSNFVKLKDMPNCGHASDQIFKKLFNLGEL